MKEYADSEKALKAMVEQGMKEDLSLVIKILLAEGLSPKEALHVLEQTLNELDENHTWTCSLEYNQ